MESCCTVLVYVPEKCNCLALLSSAAVAGGAGGAGAGGEAKAHTCHQNPTSCRTTVADAMNSAKTLKALKGEQVG
jgi:hypothetical protein